MGEFATKVQHRSPNRHLNDMGYQCNLGGCDDDGQVSPKPGACASEEVLAANETNHSYQSDCVNYDCH